MLIENNVTMIVSTCRLTEQGRTKCNQFWPKSNNAEFNISQDPNNPIMVPVEEIETEELTNFVDKRLMKATRPDGNTQMITQIHFKGWPDHGVPET